MPLELLRPILGCRRRKSSCEVSGLLLGQICFRCRLLPVSMPYSYSMGMRLPQIYEPAFARPDFGENSGGGGKNFRGGAMV